MGEHGGWWCATLEGTGTTLEGTGTTQ